jgi:cysteinyl-tRNA synthetase, unknown class
MSQWTGIKFQCAILVLTTVLAALFVAVGATHPASAADVAAPSLATVKAWDYQLRRLDSAAASGKPSDMIVVEAGPGGDGTGVKATDEIARLRIKPDGTRRLVIAYLSIGEAESYRPYWQPIWNQTPPAWLIGENCRWPKNFPVRYWMPAWQEIMIGSATTERDATSSAPSSALARIIDLGFDGVYLDRVDVFQDVVDLGERTEPQARRDMIGFVKALSGRAKAGNPNFHVIVQNAEELLDDPTYRRAIDAIAKEDLLHGLKGTGVRNAPGDIQSTRAALRRLKRDSKPVFVIEYLTTTDAIMRARAELMREKFVAVFPTRGLDGQDPVLGAAEIANQFGTPEYGAANCKGLLKVAPNAKR